MKLNWFSPLLPAATDIAHYTARVIPALSKLADVTLWTPSKQWSGSLEQFAEVRRYNLDKPPYTELNRADMTFYHIGNNFRFHWPIWFVSQVHPGVIVLHDFRLHHFFDGLYRLHYQSLEMYLKMMAQQYGPESLKDAEECFMTRGANIDYMAERYPLTDLGLGRPLGTLVHTREAFEAVQSKAEWPLAYAPLPFPSRDELKTKVVSGPPFRLIIFGYLGRNRRLGPILEALAGMPEKEKYRLDIFGEILNDEEKIRAHIRALKLSGLVKVHGFVPEAKLESALSNSDLAINLRFPSVGEASGSQLRIWSHALPSLVSAVGWYASLPSNTVALVRPDENEVNDIQNHLRALLTEPARFSQMGKNGLEELTTRHSPEAYATQVIDLAERAKNVRPQRGALALAKRAGASVREWLVSPEFDQPMYRAVDEALSLVKR
jgi:glycosyltransferase involved in cell wall biosynthesis